MWRCWCIKCDVAYLVTSLAVWAVLGVLMACSIVLGLPDWVPGLTKPLTGRPDWDMGLMPCEVLVPWELVPGRFSDVPGLDTCKCYYWSMVIQKTEEIIIEKVLHSTPWYFLVEKEKEESMLSTCDIALSSISISAIPSSSTSTSSTYTWPASALALRYHADWKRYN